MAPNELSLIQAHDGLSSKQFSCSELVDSCLSAIDTRDGEIGAFLSVFSDDARTQAERVDAAIASGKHIGLLEGIPLAVKDVILVAGERATAASRILEPYDAAYDATVIAKLRAAGAIFLGKTNCDEFAMGGSTENSAYKKTKNPWDPERVPGGSSGGSAAAVAANECIASLGSDTGGSIRQPAGFCGIVGLKPTYGAVSRSGLIAMVSSFDQIGPLAKTVEDTEILFHAIRGKDPKDATTIDRNVELTTDDLQQLKIGIPREYFASGIEPEVEKSVRGAIKTFEQMGVRIEEVSLPLSKYALSVYYILMPSEVSANLARFDGIRYGSSVLRDERSGFTLNDIYTKTRGAYFGAEVRRRIMLGVYALSSGYYDAYYKKAQQVRTLLRQEYARVFERVDCLLAPISPTLPFRFGEKVDDPLQMYLADVFTVSANVVGIPGLALPCPRKEKLPAGSSSQGGPSLRGQLPVGFQLLGRPFEESVLFSLGRAYEAQR